MISLTRVSVPENQRPDKPVDLEQVVGSLCHGVLCWVWAEVDRLAGEAGLCRLGKRLDYDLEKLRIAKDSGEVGSLGASRCSLLCGLAVVAGMTTVEVEGEVWDVSSGVGTDPEAPTSQWRKGQSGGVLL